MGSVLISRGCSAGERLGVDWVLFLGRAFRPIGLIRIVQLSHSQNIDCYKRQVRPLTPGLAWRVEAHRGKIGRFLIRKAVAVFGIPRMLH